MNDVWTLVHAERRALIQDLTDLTNAQWEQASLCAGWAVRDVAAHLVNNAKATRWGVVRDMARARFDFDRQTAAGVERERGATPAETLAKLRDVVQRTSTPPASLDSRLVEEVVHGEDIRVPLGITRAYPIDVTVTSLLYQARTSTALGGSKQRIASLRLHADDADVTIGDGALVTGPALSLLMVISGRSPALLPLFAG
ncbi:MAG: maleylpyruvate isomerase family mycothiol-dependent enzyme [Actinomycetota bacterium]|nr:maleylpyruvate isomerase family mycothiol-dependent enzyme [Actinomycetota bacterium]